MWDYSSAIRQMYGGNLYAHGLGDTALSNLYEHYRGGSMRRTMKGYERKTGS